MPSPKRSPKSPRKPPLAVISSDAQSIKTETKPMSPITRAATLPKPWSPSSTTERSLLRKYSFDEKRAEKDGVKMERAKSIDEETEKVKTSEDDKPASDGIQKR